MLNATDKVFVLEDLRLRLDMPAPAIKAALGKLASDSDDSDADAARVRCALERALADVGRGLVDFFGHEDTTVEPLPLPDDCPAGIRGFVEALQDSQNALGKASPQGISLVKWPTFEQELDGVARYLQRLIETGDVQPERCCVIVPNRQWLQLACKALERRYLTTVATSGGIQLSRDPRNLAVSANLLAYARLRLAADTNDLMGWRVLCGIGLADLGTRAWTAACEHMQARNQTIVEVMRDVALSESPIAGRAREGLEIVDQKSQLRGFSLIRACGIDQAPELHRHLDQVAGDSDAAEMLGFARQLVEGPVLVDDPLAVRVCTIDANVEAEFDVVCVIACVEGFVPAPGTQGLGSALLARAASRARRELVLSYFSKVDEQTAGRMRMTVSRTRAEQDARYAVLRPSPFFAQAGDACPSTVSGDAFLARL